MKVNYEGQEYNLKRCMFCDSRKNSIHKLLLLDETIKYFVRCDKCRRITKLSESVELAVWRWNKLR